MLGIVFAIGGAGLYFLRQFRPNLARDYDVFFAAVGLSTGIILFFFGWQLEPVHQINTLLLTCTVFFFAYESIRLRGIAVEQAKRRTPVVDDDRPVSRVYRAELDDWEQMNDRSRRQRIPSARDRYEDDYDRYQARPPYEDRRQPAGRLRPSDSGRRERPPADRGYDQGPTRDYRDAEPPRRRPPEAGDRRPRTGDSPPPRRRDRSDRTLNVRPYSERPDASKRPEGPEDGGYVNYRPVDKPPGAPVDEPQDYGNNY
ncbi:MAG: Ycf66 family protein [Cyanobacteria bacterium J06635_1]